MRRRDRVLLAMLTGLALLVRVVIIYEFGPSTLRFGDAPDYLAAASSLCATGQYPDHSSLPFFRAPGLPFFIAATTLCHTTLIALVKIAIAILGAISVVMIFLLAEEVFQDRRVGLLAAAVASIYPFFIAQSSDLQTEGLFMFLLLTALWMTLRAIKRLEPLHMFVGGVCASAAALVRPVGLLLLLLLPAGAIFLRRPDTKRAWLVTSFALAAIVSLGPWIIRNAVRYHEFIIVNDAGGYNAWRGTSPEMEEIERIEDAQTFLKASLKFETVTSPALARQVDSGHPDITGRERQWYILALENFSKCPGAFTLRLVRNAWAYWRPWLNPSTHSKTVVIVSGVLVSGLYLLAIVGWNSLRKRDSRLAVWCTVCALVFWISQIPFQVASRFRVSTADPLLIIFAVAPLARLVNPTVEVTGMKRFWCRFLWEKRVGKSGGGSG